MSENNACACAFYILVDFFAVSGQTTTSNDKIMGFVEKVNTSRLIFLSLFELKVVLRSKNTFIFSSDFKMLFTKHTPCEILGLYFEKKSVYLKYNFPIYWSAIITPERIQ